MTNVCRGRFANTRINGENPLKNKRGYSIFVNIGSTCFEVFIKNIQSSLSGLNGNIGMISAKG